MGHCPGDARDASIWICQLPGPVSCWFVTLSLLVLHTQGLEAEGLLLPDLVALATLGRMRVVSLVTPGKTACRAGGKWTGQRSGWVAQAEPGQTGPLRLQACGEGQAYGIAQAACWPFPGKPESRGPGGLGACLVRPEALMGQPRKWEEMGVRVGSEENIVSG